MNSVLDPWIAGPYAVGWFVALAGNLALVGLGAAVARPRPGWFVLGSAGLVGLVDQVVSPLAQAALVNWAGQAGIDAIVRTTGTLGLVNAAVDAVWWTLLVSGTARALRSRT